MDEKVRYPIERSPFYPHSFIIFFVFRFISLPQYFSFARFLYSYLYGVAHNYAHRKEIKKKKMAHANFFCVRHITRNENGAGSHRHTLWPLRDANDECSRSPPLAFSNGGKWISIFMRQMGSRRPLNKTGNRKRAIRVIVLHI